MCGAGLVSCPSPEGEGMERRKAQNTGTLRRRPPALRSAGSPSGAPAVASLVSGRSSGLGPTSMTSPDPGGIGAALQPVRVQPLKAAPSRDGAGGDRDDPCSCSCKHRNPGATPTPPSDTSGRRPSVSGCADLRPRERAGKIQVSLGVNSVLIERARSKLLLQKEISGQVIAGKEIFRFLPRLGTRPACDNLDRARLSPATNAPQTVPSPG